MCEWAGCALAAFAGAAIMTIPADLAARIERMYEVEAERPSKRLPDGGTCFTWEARTQEGTSLAKKSPRCAVS